LGWAEWNGDKPSQAKPSRSTDYRTRNREISGDEEAERGFLGLGEGGRGTVGSDLEVFLARGGGGLGFGGWRAEGKREIDGGVCVGKAKSGAVLGRWENGI